MRRRLKNYVPAGDARVAAPADPAIRADGRFGLDRPYGFWYIGTPRGRYMCLAVPAKIIKIEESRKGIVSYMGTDVRTDFALVPDARPGDWVIVHAGFAISVMDAKEARATLRLFREMAKV